MRCVVTILVALCAACSEGGTSDGGIDAAEVPEDGSLPADDLGVGADPDLSVPPAFVVTPGSANLRPNRTLALAADRPVTWSIVETNGGTLVGVTATTVDFVAPHGFGVVHVRAVDVADASLVVEVPITVGFTVLQLVAGTPSGDGVLDGPVATARLKPRDIAVSSTGSVYFVEQSSSVIRKVVPGGMVTTVAGVGQVVWNDPGAPFTGADGGPGVGTFAWARGLQLDEANNRLFVGDVGAIRAVDLTTGAITTIAGKLNTPGHVDGIATARIQQPSAMWLSGNELFFTGNDSTVRRVLVDTGQVSTLAGLANADGFGDAPARFGRNPQGLTGDATYLYVADTDNHILRKITRADGTTTTLAGTGGAGNGYANSATPGLVRFSYPQGLARSGGVLYVADTANGMIRTVDATSGETDSINQGAWPALQPTALAVSGTTLLLSDTRLSGIRAVDLGALTIANVTGIPAKLGPATGAGLAAGLFQIHGLAVGDGESLYSNTGFGLQRFDLVRAGGGLTATVNAAFGGWSPYVVYRGGKIYGSMTKTLESIQTSDAMTATISSGTPGYGGVALGPPATGVAWVAGEFVVREVDLASGVATERWGSSVAAGATDDVGTAARFYYLRGITYDAGSNRIYVSDGWGTAIRELDVATGLTKTVAGTSGVEGSSDGIGTAARLFRCRYLTADGHGNVYFSQPDGKVRRLDVATGQVSTLLTGLPTTAALQPGPIATARLRAPEGLALLSDGELAIADDASIAVLK